MNRKINLPTRILLPLCVLIVIVVAGLLIWKHYRDQNLYSHYPSGYPWTCEQILKQRGTVIGVPGCDRTEDAGKVIVSWRPEVKDLVKKYGSSKVTVNALETELIKDKAYVYRL